jgi:phosphatidylglycerophosphate synthase
MAKIWYNNVNEFLGRLGSSLAWVNNLRDELFFLVIKPYWPRRITPNHVTYIRIIAGIALAVLLFGFAIEDKALILSLFCIGAFTDLLDGSVARGINKVTEFGSILDSIADRFLIIPIAVYSLIQPHPWLLLSLLAVEAINMAASLYCRALYGHIESNIFGKTKMFIVSVVFIAILLEFPHSPTPFFIGMLWISIPFSSLSIISKLSELKTLLANQYAKDKNLQYTFGQKRGDQADLG